MSSAQGTSYTFEDASPDEIQKTAYRMISRPDLDMDIRRALDELLEEGDRLARIVTSDDGFLDYLATHLSREQTKLNAYNNGRPEDHPYDGERTDPMCLCGDPHCPLKRGEMPRKIRTADEPLARLRAFKNDHPGDPLVLQDVQTSYDEKRARFMSIHRTVVNCGRHNVHPDEYEQANQQPRVEGEAE